MRFLLNFVFPDEESRQEVRRKLRLLSAMMDMKTSDVLKKIIDEAWKARGGYKHFEQ
jgi:hypothetical protein